ncbi:MAG: sirohydrochlorin cobaltochelatase [Syntrophobacteraceae bacterium]|nr:sirohydrochlorin cobaltochelatase [Syntrophobacteraceae bacterium]
MQKIWFVLALMVLFSLVSTAGSFASHEGAKPPRKAVLLVAFGTSVPEAQKAFDQIGKQAGKAFPGVEIRWAYTSSMIRAKLARQGKILDSPETALARLMDEGYTHVAVLSLHVIPGLEFHDLYTNAMLFGNMSGGFEKIVVARPLLDSRSDMERVAKALLKRIPAGRKADDAVLFMGHGSEKHPADAMYAAMNYVFQGMSSNVHVGTVSGYPSLDDLLPGLLDAKIKKAWLIPFMTVAGDHARNDMAGDDPDSWKSVLAKKGIRSEAVLTGMAEYPEIVEIWLDHLRDAFARL